MISVPTVACRVTGRFIYRSEIRRVSADGAVRIVPTGDPRTPEIGEVLQDVPIDVARGLAQRGKLVLLDDPADHAVVAVA